MSNVQTSSTAALPQVQLEILRGRANRKVRRIDVPVYLIGSAPDCDLVLADTTFPEVHTYVYVTKQGVSVRRLGEGPELKVNGEAVQSATLNNGERVQLGSFEFTVRVVPPPHGRLAPASELETAPAVTATMSFAPGVAEVMALLADIRATLKIESSLKLYIEPESVRMHGLPHSTTPTRKATA
jgi:pSer/pThr/pTyr-binding forkhead associated (FHA) protein